MPKTATTEQEQGPRFRAYTLTAAGYAATDDPHRRRTPTTMSAVTDLKNEFSRVNLLLEEAILTLVRAEYTVSEAAIEVGERIHVVTATVHARLAVERDTQAAKEAR